MANYVGEKCPVCESVFAAEDDVVVCPICGTPHHRTCYRQAGHCALEERHAQGFTWQRPVYQQTASPTEGEVPPPGSGDADSVRCPCCQAPNPPFGIFCQTCGAPIKRPDGDKQDERMHNAYTMAFGGLSPTEEIDGVTVQELAAFVGTNSAYFIPRFKMLSEHGGLSINLGALFFSFFYFFYRKMYGLGLILLSLVLLAYLPTMMLLPEWIAFCVEHLQDMMLGIDVSSLFHPQSHLWALKLAPFLTYLPPMVALFGGLMGNRLYMLAAVRKIKRLRAACTGETGTLDAAAYTHALSRKGRTMIGAVLFLGITLVVAYFAIFTILLLPHMDAINVVMAEFINH